MEFYIFAATALARPGRSQLEVFSSIWCLYLLLSCSSVGAAAVQNKLCTICVNLNMDSLELLPNFLSSKLTTGFYVAKLDEIGYQVCFSSWRDVYETIQNPEF